MVTVLPIFISATDFCKGKLKVPHRLQMCEHSVSTSAMEYKNIAKFMEQQKRWMT
jgi:hypothetical protein